ncbi:MAG: helix-turn-helix domain-containing protein [Imperialibacter sp.]|uniref:helix-turn-helix domain-containing protein n=1 Tax=Imperialibacter sp. TaxID=2038411 RepID=UPI003A895367
MTHLGEYLEKKAISKAAVSNRTGISRSRISELANNPATHLKAKELYLIALAIDVEPHEMLKEVFKEVTLLK